MSHLMGGTAWVLLTTISDEEAEDASEMLSASAVEKLITSVACSCENFSSGRR